MRSASTPLPPDVPRSDAAFADVLQEWFGVGSWDGEEPYWKARGRDAAKIKASRRKRDVALAELYVAAMYCKSQRIPVRGVTWLYGHIGKAWQWWEAEATARAEAPFQQAYAEAIAASDPQWRVRLTRTAPSFRREVYQEWLSTR